MQVLKNTTIGSFTLLNYNEGGIFGGIVKLDSQGTPLWVWSFLIANGVQTSTTLVQSVILSIKFASGGHILASGYCGNRPVCVLGPGAVLNITGDNGSLGFWMKLTKDTGQVMAFAGVGSGAIANSYTQVDDIVELDTPGEYYVTGYGNFFATFSIGSFNFALTSSAEACFVGKFVAQTGVSGAQFGPPSGNKGTTCPKLLYDPSLDSVFMVGLFTNSITMANSTVLPTTDSSRSPAGSIIRFNAADMSVLAFFSINATGAFSYINGMVRDGAGNLIIDGFYSTNAVLRSFAMPDVTSTKTLSYVAKLDAASLTVLDAKPFGTNGRQSELSDIAYLPSGNYVAVGHTRLTNFTYPTNGAWFNPTATDDFTFSSVAMIINSTLDVIAANGMGAAGETRWYSVAAGVNGEIVVGGKSSNNLRNCWGNYTNLQDENYANPILVLYTETLGVPR